MTDSEKLTELKRAYAEIILNTAKEAAARIMASERKAERYRRELVSSKGEALRMLLRLKHMMESQLNEAEVKSKIQSEKIDVLEAQLGEAEDIVKDLRSDLRELHDKLERLTKPKQLSTAPKVSECEIFVQHESMDTMGMMESFSNGTTDSHTSFKKPKIKDEDFPEYASIRVARKEPELYRNGCTHRVRASESGIYGESLNHESFMSIVSLDHKAMKSQENVGQDCNAAERRNSRRKKKKSSIMSSYRSTENFGVSLVKERRSEEATKSLLSSIVLMQSETRGGCANLEANGWSAGSSTKSEKERMRQSMEVTTVFNEECNNIACDAIEGCRKPSSERILKFTFQRKRKKELPGCLEGDSSTESNVLKERTNADRFISSPKSSSDVAKVEQPALQLLPLTGNNFL